MHSFRLRTPVLLRKALSFRTAVPLSLSLLCACSGAGGEPVTGADVSGSTGGADSSKGGATSGGTTSGRGGDGALESSGGTQSGGQSTGSGGGSDGSGGQSSSLVPPQFETKFTSLDGFHVATKSQLIPGSTATTVSNEKAEDQSALSLFVKGNAAYSSSDYAGPGAHAIEVVKDGAAQLYGRYEFDVQFPSCAPTEELVSGLFTYFNDGSDADDDGINDNSEIDIEHLCGTPEYLFLTVWTDYQETPSTSFRRSSRMINMRTGAYSETPLGSSSWDDMAPAGTLAEVNLSNFPADDTFYTFGFEWSAEHVRYFLISDGIEIDLYTVNGQSYVPQRAAALLLNLWHSSTHWADGGGAADFPVQDARLLIDGVRVWTVDQL